MMCENFWPDDALEKFWDLFRTQVWTWRWHLRKGLWILMIYPLVTMKAWIFVAIQPVEIFHRISENWPASDVKGKTSGLPESLGFILMIVWPKKCDGQFKSLGDFSLHPKIRFQLSSFCGSNIWSSILVRGLWRKKETPPGRLHPLFVAAFFTAFSLCITSDLFFVFIHYQTTSILGRLAAVKLSD